MKIVTLLNCDRGETLFSIQLLQLKQLEHEGYHQGGRAQQHQIDILYIIEVFSGVAEFKSPSTINCCFIEKNMIICWTDFSPTNHSVNLFSIYIEVCTVIGTDFSPTDYYVYFSVHFYPGASTTIKSSYSNLYHIYCKTL